MFRLIALPQGLSGVGPTLSSRAHATKPLNPLLFTRRRQRSSSSQAAETTVSDHLQAQNNEVSHDGASTATDTLTGEEDRATAPATMIDHLLPASLHERKDATASAQPEPHTPSKRRESLWRFGGDKRQHYRRLSVRHDTVDLGTASLGRPATIRIVREMPLRPIPEEVRVVQGPATGAEELESLALATPKTDASPKEVDDVIQKFREDFFALRPIEGAFTREQCVTVAKRLSDSLTYEQLAAHFKRHEKQERKVESNNLEHFYRSKLISRARWFSNTSSFPGTAIKRLDRKERNPTDPNAITSPQPKRTMKLSAKERLVERILRQLWGIREKGEVKYGELDLRIHSGYHLKLLLMHTNELFQKWSEQFGVRIEISESDNIVRIVGPYALTADVFSLLLRNLQRVEAVKMKLSEDTAPSAEGSNGATWHDLCNRAYLDQVEHLTRTKIQANVAKSSRRPMLRSVLIHYLGPDGTNLDDARRLIAQTMEQKDSTKTHFLCDSSGGKLPLEVPVQPGSILHMKERHINWMRWRYAEPFKSQAEMIDEITSDRLIYDPASSRGFADSGSRHLFTAFGGFNATKNVQSTYWEAAQEQQLSAFIGLLAHPKSPEMERALRKVRSQLPSTESEEETRMDNTLQSFITQPHTLLPGVPDLWARLNAVVTSVPQSKHQLLIRLKPGNAASISAKDLRLLPDMELTFDIDEGERTSLLQSVRLIRTWRQSDLLLLAQATDLRFEARSLIRPSDQIDPAILEFARNSKLDVFGDGRLQTPTRMDVLVPRFASEDWPVPERGDSVHAKDGMGWQSLAPNELMVTYFFASLEHRSSLTATYQGHPFTFSTVEAGRTGGRRDELRFDLPDLELSDGNWRDAATRQLYLDWFNNVREFNARLFR